jgi:hypothetical protein
MSIRLTASLVALLLAAPALAQTSTQPSGDTRFRQDAVQDWRHRQATRAEIEQRATTPGSPLAGQPLIDTSKEAERTTDRLYEETLKNSKGVTPDDPSARPPVGSPR